MVTTKLNLSMTEPQVRQIYAKQGDTGRVLDITLDQTPEDGTLRILRPDGVEVTSEAVTGGEVSESGETVTFDSLTEADVTELTVGIEPVQDLNGYDKPWVGGAGKNKLPYPYTIASSGTINGVTYTVNGDGSITLTGTATGQVDLALFSPNGYSLDSGTYKITLGGIKNGIKWIYGGSGSAITYNELPHTVADQTFDVTSSGTCGYCIIRIANGTATNTTLYPMIRLATETDATFAPYSNICPITGHDEVTVTLTGKNLCSQTGGNNAVIGQAKEGMTYTFSIRNQGSCGYNIKKNNNSGATIATTDGEHPTDAVISVTFTADEDCNLFLNGYGMDGYTFLQSAYDYQLEFGSTATSYEPYRSNTYTTSLGQTVYGGTLDLVTGVLTVDRAMVDMGSLSWSMVASGFYATISNGKNDVKDSICELYKFNPSANNTTGSSMYSVLANGEYAWYSNQSRIFVKDTAYSNATTFKTSVNGYHVVYELATPVEYQLTPQQIKTLVGTNNVWASSGDIVSIKFTYGGLLSELPSEATEIVGKCYCDVEQNGVSSMPFTLNVKKNERES